MSENNNEPAISPIQVIVDTELEMAMHAIIQSIWRLAADNTESKLLPAIFLNQDQVLLSIIKKLISDLTTAQHDYASKVVNR